MKSSYQLDALGTALAEAQKSFPIIPKTQIGKIEGRSKASGNEYSYEYKYADLADVVEAVRKILGENGLSFVQSPSYSEDGFNTLTTRLIHASGQWLEDSMRIYVPQETPQVQGSSITYARRYSLCSMLGLITDSDDDGALAQLAYGDENPRGRRRAAPKSGGKGNNTNGGSNAQKGSQATPQERNKILKAYSQQDPPVTRPGAVAVLVSEIIGRQIDKLDEITPEEATAVKENLGVTT